MCKTAIHFGQKYWVCNVSTCNRKRTGLAFCKVACWDAHLPTMNHRESWAEERRAPTPKVWAEILAAEDQPRTRKPREKVEAEPSPTAPVGPARVILRRGSGV